MSNGGPVVLWLHEGSLRDEGCALSMRVIPLRQWLQLVRDAHVEVTPYPGAPSHLPSAFGELVALRVEQPGSPESWAFGVPVAALGPLADLMAPADYAALLREGGLAPDIG